MPYDQVAVPLTEDRREPTTIDQVAGQRLVNVRTWNQRIDKFGGLTQLGTTEVLANVPRNFFEGVFPDGTRRLLAISSGAFQLWNGTIWGSNLSSAAGRPAVPAPANVRYSIVNTLGKVYIATGGNSNILVWDQTLVAPGDLILMTGHGVPTVTKLNCRVLLGFADRLVMVRTIEDNVEFPNRIRWSAETVAPEAGGFNTSLTGPGVDEVVETSTEPLTGGFVIGERCFLTKAHEILELIPTGQAAPAFKIESRVTGTGVISPFSVAVAQNVATFIGSDSVFAYNGSQLRDVGPPIRDVLSPLFESRGTDQLRPIAAIYPRRNEYHLLPFLSGRTIFVYDYVSDRWFEQDMQAVVSGNEGPSTLGTISAALYSGAIQTQTLVMNGSLTRNQTAFILDETVTDRVGYGSNSLDSQIACQVKTRQLFPHRRGYRGVVEPAATDRLNILWEVAFKGAASTTVIVTATDAGGDTDTQTVTTDAGGRGKAYFNLPWQCVDFTFENTGTGNFQLMGAIGYRWTEGGIHIPVDPDP